MKYEKYKDSGLEWVGKVPSHWRICRFKDFTTLQNIASIDEDNKIGLENIEGKTGRFIESSSEFEGNGIQFEIGDIVYGKLRPYLQKVWVATFAGNAVGDFFVFKAKDICYNKYLFYIMLSDGFTSLCNGATLGAKMPRVSSDFIRCLHFFLPPIEEQHAIASYLDKKCRKINTVIDTQKRKIELLNELKQTIITNAVTKGLNPDVATKDSGVEWIGEVPNHWEVCKTLHCLSQPITDGPHETPELFPEGIPFVSAEAVSCGNGSIDFNHIRGFISEEYYRECCKKYTPQKDDVYMIKSGATTGKVAMVDTDIKFTIWSPLAVFRCNQQKMLPKFLFHSLTCPFYQVQVELGWNYGTQQNIGMRTLEKLYLIVPPINEQHDILSYLDEKLADVNSQISKTFRRIELLQELKQSIITEAVTGKIKVC